MKLLERIYSSKGGDEVKEVPMKKGGGGPSKESGEDDGAVAIPASQRRGSCRLTRLLMLVCAQINLVGQSEAPV